MNNSFYGGVRGRDFQISKIYQANVNQEDGLIIKTALDVLKEDFKSVKCEVPYEGFAVAENILFKREYNGDATIVAAFSSDNIQGTIQYDTEAAFTVTSEEQNKQINISLPYPKIEVVGTNINVEKEWNEESPQDYKFTLTVTDGTSAGANITPTTMIKYNQQTLYDESENPINKSTLTQGAPVLIYTYSGGENQEPKKRFVASLDYISNLKIDDNNNLIVSKYETANTTSIQLPIPKTYLQSIEQQADYFKIVAKEADNTEQEYFIPILPSVFTKYNMAEKYEEANSEALQAKFNALPVGGCWFILEEERE